MAVKPYMPFYTSEYMNDTAHLTMAEHGAYLLLIIHYWHTEKPLPDDEKKLAQICRTTLKGFRQIKLTVSLLFTQRGNTWVHKRIEKELAIFRQKSDLARLSAMKRWENGNENSDANAMRTQCYTDTDTDTDTEEKKTNTTHTAKELFSEKNLKTEVITTVVELAKKTKTKKVAAAAAVSQPVKMAAQPSALKPDVQKVFEFWATAMGHPRAKLDGKRRRRIESALKDYGAEFLCEAIAGCSRTPHNMGENDRGERYDDIELILRNSSQIERFHRNFENPPVPKPTGDRMLAHNQAVLQKIYREEDERERREREAKDVTQR